jgi:hypothetical protein
MATDNETYRATATAHIRALSALSTRLPAVLDVAATTLSQLTNSPIPTTPSAADTPQARRDAIASSANEYFTAVFSLSQELHKQVTDLEESGVIPAEEVRYVARTDGGQNANVVAQPGLPPLPPTQAKNTEATVTNNGLGEFDIGVLNARASVREGGEEQVLERVRRLLEDLQPRTEDTEGSKKADGS